MKKCWILTGGNMGDRKEFLFDAKNLINKQIGKAVLQSGIYESEAWGIENQNNFLNQVLVIETALSAQDVLNKCLEIEKSLGRIRLSKWTERVIDIDILYYDNALIEEEKLTIPHPEIQNRRFVLEPLCEISQDYIHPKLKMTNNELLRACKDKLIVWKYHENENAVKKMKEIFAEIITIGDEILFGQITDTNSQWMSAELDKIGVKTRRKTSVSDKVGEIVDALDEAFERADIILVTGGLGPTKDDLTKKVLSDYFDSELVLHEKALSDITALFKQHGFELTEPNRGQAFLPACCTYIYNKLGSAPGMWFEKDGKILVSMPGVPFEMKGLMNNSILTSLQKQFELPVIFHKMIRTAGIGESWLAEKISDWEDSLPSHIKLAYLPGMWQVRLRLTGVGSELEKLEKEVEAEFEKVKSTIEKYIFGYGDTELHQAVGEKLIAQKKTISTAESCTGGYLAHLLTSVSGSSAYYTGSIVAYQNDIKTNVLGVKESTIELFGAVSEETAKEMAEGVRIKLGTDIGFSTTGIAGPTGGTEEKPVGTVWMAFADGEKTLAWKIQLGRTRDLNIKFSSIHALNRILRNI